MKASELIDHVAKAAGIEKGQAKKAIKAVLGGPVVTEPHCTSAELIADGWVAAPSR